MKNAFIIARQKFLIFILLLISFSGSIKSQGDPAPFECAMCCSANNPGSFSANCANTSTLWSSNERHIPRTDARTIYVHANFIIPRKSDDPDPDIQGNFSENVPEHMAFLNEIVDNCNWRLRTLTGSSGCSDLRTDAKIQIIPNFIFLKDAYSWNADNSPDTSPNFKCPSQSQSNWHLANLSNQINSDPNIPLGINIFFPVQGDLYNRLVTLGTIESPDYPGSGYCKWWCSEHPSTDNLMRTSNISLTNVFMKYRWFQLYPNNTGFPFDPTGRSILIGEALRSLPHELAHSFIDDYVHFDNCSNHLLTTGGGTRDVLRATDVGCIHRNLARTNLRQFVDCSESYNNSGSNTSDRIVDVTETWDLNMRLYTNVVVKASKTLTITCEVLMPYDGTITVERGAKLIVDGGIVRRANTCTPSQFWRGVVVQGNNTLPQPDPNGSSSLSQAGVVLLKGNGLIEGAIIGAAAKGHPIWDVPEFRGGLIQATDFTFRDCRKGAEFMKYDGFVDFSKFNNVLFERTSTGSMHTGVSIWDTDGVLFEGCTFKNVANTGIVSWDAIFNVKQKNQFIGAEVGILSGGSNPLSGQVKVGVLGLQGNDRNKFDDNIVGIRATANSWVEVFSNDFNNFNFDVAINGTTKSSLIDNFFASGTAGSQFENTGNNANSNLCNRYDGNSVGTNIVGNNNGFTFREEDFATDFHDLFIEGTTANPGRIPIFVGGNSAGLWNYFTAANSENIKTGTTQPNSTIPFFYFHPDPVLNARVKPECALNDVCMPQSNFTNIQTGGSIFSNCMFPEGPQAPCETKACLDVIRSQIIQKTNEYNANPTTELAAELQRMTTDRERITSILVSGYKALNDWAAIETLLNEDINPHNRRRLVGAKLEQNQFTAAYALLQSFPQNTIEDQHFVQVQSINLARLADPEFLLSSTNEAILNGIAMSNNPEAGYAQSILGLMTGQRFMPTVPDLGGERNSQHSIKALMPDALFLSPNPVSDILQVQVPQAFASSDKKTLELRDLATGILIRNIQAPDGGEISISVETLPSGMYLLTLKEQNVTIARKKVIVQH